MFDWIANPDIWLSLVTLTALEIVLGIDNLVFVAILAGKLPAHRQKLARQLGLGLALLTRLALLFTLTWLAGLTRPLFTVFGEGISWRDIVLIGGGLFLIAKATVEVHHKVESAGDEAPSAPRGSFAGVVIQIALVDIVFSFDSVLTAVGMAQQIEVMVAAIVISMAIMLVASGAVSDFVNDVGDFADLFIAFAEAGNGFGCGVNRVFDFGDTGSGFGNKPAAGIVGTGDLGCKFGRLLDRFINSPGETVNPLNETPLCIVSIVDGCL